jgi:hypothetical protein
VYIAIPFFKVLAVIIVVDGAAMGHLVSHCFSRSPFIIISLMLRTHFSFNTLSLCGATGPSHFCSLWITHTDTPQLVGLLWMRDRPVAETST